MKTNGNDKRSGDYYIGLDIGTNSAGCAVTDREYNILKFKGNAMWGVHLFDEANDASERRSKRTARRRLNRRKQRLEILEILFSEELNKKDPSFLTRLSESDLWQDDKKTGCKYSLFLMTRTIQTKNIIKNIRLFITFEKNCWNQQMSMISALCILLCTTS